MEERVRIANRVKATDEAWSNLNLVKDSIFAAFNKAECRPRHLRRIRKSESDL